MGRVGRGTRVADELTFPVHILLSVALAQRPDAIVKPYSGNEAHIVFRVRHDRHTPLWYLHIASNGGVSSAGGIESHRSRMISSARSWDCPNKQTFGAACRGMLRWLRKVTKWERNHQARGRRNVRR